MMSHARPRPPRRPLAGLLALAALGAALAGLAQLAADRPADAAPEQQARTYYLPNVQTRGYTTAGLGAANLGAGPDAARRGAGQTPAGMVGFGYSAIDLVNRGASALDVKAFLVDFDQKERQLPQALGPRGATSLALKRQRQVGLGSYSARVEAAGDVGVQVRGDWPEGGSAFSYAAPERGTELILPLAARDVYSYSSNLHIRNANTASEVNQVELNFFDRAGGFEKSMTLRLEGEESAEYDMRFDAQFDDLPVNAGDGYLNAIHYSAQQPIAVVAYGDELAGIGTSALRARPASLANAVQHLPLVRANYLGDSLIGIANRENSAVDVTIRYSGAPDSPAGAGQTIEQSLRIEARGAAFIDLSTRKRGSVTAPALPRGSGSNRGFYGSATISASGRVLAAALEEIFDGQVAKTSSGYNAFGPEDLSSAWAASVIGRGTSGRSQHLLVFNPGDAPAALDFALLDAAGRRSAEQQLTLPAGGMRLLPVPAGPQAEQALLESSSPVAVLDYETAFATAGSWGRWGSDSLIEWAVPVPGGGGETPPTGTSAPATQTPEPTVSSVPRPSETPPSPTPEPGLTPSATTPVDPWTMTPPPTEGPTIYLPMCRRGN